MIEKIKEIHPNCVVLIKQGSFYREYGDDAIILSAIQGYMLKPYTTNSSTCGFPVDSLPKIARILEDKKINYLAVDSRNEYDKTKEVDFGNLNKYEEIRKRAYEVVKRREDIKKISARLERNIEKENFKSIIRKIEDVLDEAGEI